MLDLKKYAVLLDKYLTKRSKHYEGLMTKLYKWLIGKILKDVGDIYQKYERDGGLQRQDMMKYKRLDKFKRSILLHVNSMSKDKKKLLEKQLEESYEYSYDWMAWAIQKETSAKFPHVIGREEIKKRAAENEVTHIKLNDTLEKHRKTIVKEINKTVERGINEGLSYKQMADNLTDTLDGDRQKAIRTARTETHRVREQGVLDVAKRANDGGVVMAKEWMSMHDEKVRSEHSVLDGQTVPVNEDFEYMGHKAQGPSMFGVPSLDINCRCVTGFTVMAIKAQSDGDLAKRTFEEYREHKAE